MSRFAASMVGGLILAILAAGLAEATLAVGQRGSLSNDIGLRPFAKAASPTPRLSATPKPSPQVTPSATPTPSPSASPAAPTATTVAFVHLRAAASTSSEILANLNGSTTVTILSGGDTDWQEVEWNGLTGFIFKSYLSY
jgi:SH3 domain-containing protein